MGNTIGRDKGEETVDGGQLVPNGVYKGPQDWDYRSVRKFIIERKLAPFYKGLSDYDESWDEVTLTTHNLPKAIEGEKTATLSVECQSQGSREIKRATTLNVSGTTKGKEASPVKTLESQLYKGAVECPICFLYYPRNINHSRCCDQPICTECFVQIKRPENGSLGANNSPAVCPYCVEPNFGVYYKPPTFNGIENMPVMIPNPNIPPSTSPTSSTSSLNNVSDGKARRRSISHKDSEVVTTDQIRPDWAARVLQQPLRQPPGARRPSPAAPSGSSRRIVVRPGGGNPTFVTSTTPPRRTNPPPTAAAEYGGYLAAMRMGTDLEELMVMEAIRLSLLEQDRERRERERTDSSQDEISNPSSQDEDRERREREERERTGSSQDENSDPSSQDENSDPSR